MIAWMEGSVLKYHVIVAELSLVFWLIEISVVNWLSVLILVLKIQFSIIQSIRENLIVTNDGGVNLHIRIADISRILGVIIPYISSPHDVATNPALMLEEGSRRFDSIHAWSYVSLPVHDSPCRRKDWFLFVDFKPDLFGITLCYAARCKCSWPWRVMFTSPRLGLPVCTRMWIACSDW